MSASGNMIPQSRTTMRLSTSMTAQLRPISPRPPRKLTRTCSGKRSAWCPMGGTAGGSTEAGHHQTGLAVELGGGGAEGGPALSGREAEGPAGGLGRDRVRMGVGGFEVVGLDEAGVHGTGAVEVALGHRAHHLAE